MSEYVVDFGDKSSAFVGLAMAEAESHGATLKERVVRCRDCKRYRPKEGTAVSCRFEFGNLIQWRSAEPNGFCAWGERRGA